MDIYTHILTMFIHKYNKKSKLKFIAMDNFQENKIIEN